MKPITIEYACDSCGHDFELEVTTHRCTPRGCPNCDSLIDLGDAQQKAAEQQEDEREYEDYQ